MFACDAGGGWFVSLVCFFGSLRWCYIGCLIVFDGLVVISVFRVCFCYGLVARYDVFVIVCGLTVLVGLFSVWLADIPVCCVVYFSV